MIFLNMVLYVERYEWASAKFLLKPDWVDIVLAEETKISFQWFAIPFII